MNALDWLAVCYLGDVVYRVGLGDLVVKPNFGERLKDSKKLTHRESAPREATDFRY